MRRGHVSLERALSKLGLATRSEARALIVEGRVRVGGRLARNPLQEVVPERIVITIDEAPARPPEPITIALHKPRGVVTTRRDPEGRTTVYDLIAELGVHVVPVGRLDFATSGLLLMTNDTRLADWLTDPVNEIPRIYLATVRGRVAAEAARQLEAGVRVDGEVYRARSVELRKASGRESLLVIELVEGKNREIRRMMSALDLELTRLRRVAFGGITVDGLAISNAELARVFPHAPTKKLRASTARV
jgi:23S rRNA pseudouridine2605 synthase